MMHTPCCTTHGIDMTCERYRRSHFVEVRPCCTADRVALEADEARAALIEGVKIDARNRMRHDSRVWHEALEGALDALLPALWDAAAAQGFFRARRATEAVMARLVEDYHTAEQAGVAQVLQAFDEIEAE